MRLAFAVMVGGLATGCGKPCSKATDVLSDCNPDEEFEASESCDLETRPNCEAECVLSAHAERGCDGIFEPTLRGDYLTCLYDCAELQEGE